MRHEQVLQSQNTKVSVIVEGKPNQLYLQGMRSFEQYDEICKYFAEGKQRDNDANEIQKHLQLYDLSLGEYLPLQLNQPISISGLYPLFGWNQQNQLNCMKAGGWS